MWSLLLQTKRLPQSSIEWPNCDPPDTDSISSVSGSKRRSRPPIEIEGLPRCVNSPPLGSAPAGDAVAVGVLEIVDMGSRDHEDAAAVAAHRGWPTDGLGEEDAAIHA